MDNPVDYTFTALTLWREGRGEPIEARRAIYWVIRNRMNDKRWPDTAYAVCTQPKQFSCYNADDLNATLLPSQKIAAGWRAWNECLQIVDNPGADPTNGANHYHTKAIRPNWHNALKVTARIGAHIFLKL